MKRILLAVLAVSVISGVPSAGAVDRSSVFAGDRSRDGDPAMLDFRGVGSGPKGSIDGLTCTLPVHKGGSRLLSVVITSDSSRRTATASYALVLAVGRDETHYLPVGEGQVTVLKGAQWEIGDLGDGELGMVGGVTERPGPKDRHTCTYQTMVSGGTAELVHMGPVRLPPADVIAAACAEVPSHLGPCNY